MRKIIVSLVFLSLISVAFLLIIAQISYSQGATPVALPTYTPFPTFTPLPPNPTYTPLPTYTPVPAYIVIPPSQTPQDSGTDWLKILPDMLAFLVGVSAACAWPLAIVLLIFYLRTPLIDLTQNIRRVKVGNIEAEFVRGVQKLEQEAEGASLSTKDLEEDERASRLYRLADVSPRAAIIEAWILVEDELREVAIKNDLNVSQRTSIVQILKMLEKSQLVSPKIISIIQELRYLRNIASHELEFYEGADQVINYVDFSLSVLRALESKGQESN